MDFSTLDSFFNFVQTYRVMPPTPQDYTADALDSTADALDSTADAPSPPHDSTADAPPPQDFIVDDLLISIADDLAILKVIVIAPPIPPFLLLEDDALQVLKYVAVGAESIIKKFDLTKMSADLAYELETKLFILLTPVRDWKEEAWKIYEERPKPSRQYHPKTSPLLFVDRLVENLEDLMKMKAVLLGPLSYFISLFREKLLYLSTKRRTETYLMENVTHLAYEAEYAIDSFLVKDVPLWYSVQSLLNIRHEFALLERESTADLSSDDDIVGFKEEIKSMFGLLTRGSPKLSVVSVVGMAGQGKTTLATKMYNDSVIVGHFDIRTHCVVSQTYEKKDLLLQLLDKIVDITTMKKSTDHELSETLHKSLSGRRFLIYLDDIWKIDAWNDLSNCFPNKNDGSRIMFTTRNQELVSETNGQNILQDIKPLSDDEGLELLRKRVFPKELVPRELLDYAKQIAKICKGLPLSLVLAAGILSKLERSDDEWRHIAEKFSSQSVDDAGATGIIDLSYKQLLDNIKPCFLYFGAFLEDRDIPLWKLQKIWSAEGFIKRKDGESIEEVTEGYLKDLVGRSLVKVSKKKSDGGVKSCQIHDLLRDFCLSKSKEENFLQLVRGYDDLFPSSNDTPSSEPIVYNLRRICIYAKSNHFIKLKPSGPLVRTLLFIALNDTSRANDQIKRGDGSDISFISDTFKLLRILDLEEINISDNFEGINMLVRLRYLAVQGYFSSIPASIAKLKHLETLNVKGFEGEVVKVPDCIWDMAKLRHVHVNDNASFDIEPHRLEESSSMSINLQSFSTPSLTYGDVMEKIMRRLGSIRELKCKFLDSWDESEECNKFPVLEFLEKLESLQVIYNGMVKYPCAFNFPSNLKKLKLSKFHMPWDQISQLASICENLEILKLVDNACDGESWEIEEDLVFPKLKFLKLDTLNVKTWIALSQNFPLLENLILHKCENLEEIPSDFENSATLEMIKVMWCNTSTATSAMNIQEEQLAYNEKFKVDILPKLFDYQLSSPAE